MVAMITDREADTTLMFMKINGCSQNEIDSYLKDQEDISRILLEDGCKTFSELSSYFDHDISPALSYLVHSGKISFTVPPDGNISYWDWSYY
jgi:hypothetical protein